MNSSAWLYHSLAPGKVSYLCRLSLAAAGPSSAQHLLQVLEVLGDRLLNLEDAQVGSQVVLLFPHVHQHGAHLCDLIERSRVAHTAGKGPCRKPRCDSEPAQVHGLLKGQPVALFT